MLRHTTRRMVARVGEIQTVTNVAIQNQQFPSVSGGADGGSGKAAAFTGWCYEGGRGATTAGVYRRATAGPIAKDVNGKPLEIAARATSKWENVPMGPPDPILGLSVAYAADTDPQKVNLGVGAYRDDDGKPYVLKCVREAEKRVEGNFNMEYAGITGVPDFVTASQKLLLGADSPALAAGRVVSSQTISGTGALRVAGQFLSRFYPFPNGRKEIYVPKPTWGNHIPIFKDSGMAVKEYRYYDAATCGLDINGMLADIQGLPYGSVVVLHACAHNPTGVDPTPEQWRQISDVCTRYGHFPFFDSAYQGFASGDPDKDAFAVRHFIASGHQTMITQSFAKNVGLYGQRVGAIHLVCDSAEEKATVESQLKIVIRPMYSNPPVHGARLVSTILNDAQLTAQWKTEVKLMADRIIDMRKALTAELHALGSTGPRPGLDWSHINAQIGMFCFTGLNAAQSKRMIDEFHVYLTSNGRISMAGVTTKNVKHVAKAIHECTK